MARAALSNRRPRRFRREHDRARVPAWTETLEARRLLSAASALASHVISWYGQNQEVADGRWVVQLQDVHGTRDGQLKSAGKFAAALNSAVYAKQQLVSDGLFLFDVPSNYGTTHVLDLLGKLPGVKSIEPDFIYHLDATSPNDQQYTAGAMWGLNNTGQAGGTNDVDINAPEAWDISTGNPNTVVADVDTGMDMTHPDLAPNLWTNPGEIAGNGIDDDGNGFVDDVHGWDFLSNDNDPTDLNSHGSHTAGTIGAKGNNTIGVTGVNWNVKLMPLRIGGSSPADSTVLNSAAIAAVNYINLMKNRGTNVRVANHSWGGGGFSNSLYTAMQTSGTLGILHVCAAGNGGSDGIGDNMDAPGAEVNYPGAFDLPNVICVANITRTGSLNGGSNYGATSVDLAAPGTSVISTVPVSQGSYASFTGTSMATPHVTGAVGLLLGLSPTASYQTIKAAILNNVKPLASVAGKTVTGGMLDLYKAALPFAKVPDLANSSDSGSSNTDNITNVNTPTFTGNASSNVAVQLMANGVQVGSGMANATGDYTITVASALPDGTYDMTASWPGSSGPTGPITIVVDTVAQAPAAPDLDSSSDSGVSTTDNITNNTSVKVLATAERGTLTLFRNGVSLGNSSVTDPSTGVAYNGVSLGSGDGTYSFTASIVDIAGNVSAVGAPLSVTLDTTVVAPSTPALQPQSDSGAKGDGITNKQQPTFAGNAEAGSLKLMSDGLQVAFPTISGGIYTVTSAVPLGNGTHIITAQVTDVAGNVSTVSGGTSITIDSIPPTVTNSGFVFDGGGPQRFFMTFSENVQSTVSKTDLQLFNPTTFNGIDPAALSVVYNAGTNTATWTFPGLPYGAITDDNYQASVNSGDIADVAGNSVNYASDPFFFLNGDANHDRSVDLTDFTLLAANFNGTGKTFGQGDFSYDGSVDLTDFTILAGKFNTSLPPDAAPATAAVASVAAAPAPAPGSSSLFSGVTIGTAAPAPHLIDTTLA